MFNNNVKFDLHVENMHCEHCAARVAAAAASVKGVKKAKVDLASASLQIIGAKDIDPDAVISAVNAAGYPASK